MFIFTDIRPYKLLRFATAHFRGWLTVSVELKASPYTKNNSRERVASRIRGAFAPPL
ncbi:hypothetical protein CCP2SC5_430017 [Azospirillaceae bacterium]